MGRVYVFLAMGFEEIEAFAPIDILRRAGVEVLTVSIKDSRYVEGAHKIVVKADTILREADIANAAAVILPGGMPGAEELAACHRLNNALKEYFYNGGVVGAICAAPMVLGRLELLGGFRATCYPGFERYLKGAIYTGKKVEIDRNLITAYGPGAALDFGFALLARFVDKLQIDALKAGMMVRE